MTDHWIRLRGGWEWSDAEHSGDPVGRVNLPLDPDTRVSGVIRFSRWFHAPPLDPASEQVVLHLADVPGLRGVWLNDRRLALRLTPGEPFILPLDALAARNRLVLEAQLPPAGCGESARASWGAIALVIRGRSASPPRI